MARRNRWEVGELDPADQAESQSKKPHILVLTHIHECDTDPIMPQKHESQVANSTTSLHRGYIGAFGFSDESRRTDLLLTAGGKEGDLYVAVEGIAHGREVAFAKVLRSAQRVIDTLADAIRREREDRDGDGVFKLQLGLIADEWHDLPRKEVFRGEVRFTMKQSLATPGNFHVRVEGFGKEPISFIAVKHQCNPWPIILAIIGIIIAAIFVVDHFVNCRTTGLAYDNVMVGALECWRLEGLNQGTPFDPDPFIPDHPKSE